MNQFFHYFSPLSGIFRGRNVFQLSHFNLAKELITINVCKKITLTIIPKTMRKCVENWKLMTGSDKRHFIVFTIDCPSTVVASWSISWPSRTRYPMAQIKATMSCQLSRSDKQKLIRSISIGVVLIHLTHLNSLYFIGINILNGKANNTLNYFWIFMKPDTMFNK